MPCLLSVEVGLSSQFVGLSTTKGHKASSYMRCQASINANEHLFVFGLGYTGRAVANTLKKSGWTVAGTCRQPEQHLTLASQGLNIVCVTHDQIDKQTENKVVQALRNTTHILCTIPPSPQDTLAAELVLAHAASSVQWVGYLSSTSVYGDWGGNWVDESSELRPTSTKCIQRAEAEAAWLNLHQKHGLPVHVFRLGGIYGPGRSALDAAKQKGTASASQQRRSLQQYTARCHVQDICTALSASMRQPNPGSIYNVVDDDPSGRATVIAFAASLLQTQHRSPLHGSSASTNDDAVTLLQEGSLSVADISQQQSQTGAETGSSGIMQVVTNGSRPEKRVCNAKIKAELSLTLEFPSYREGLTAIHAGDRCPFD